VLLKHVGDLLEAARLDARKVQLHFATADLAALVRAVAANFDALAAERRIDYRVAAEAPLPAELDPEKIERVLLNVLVNAFKLTPPGGAIHVSLAAADGRARLVVADSGPGVPPELREAIFERFRQVEGSATRRHGGTGLGLAIARDLVTLHGGRIAVDEADEGGARFTVELPTRAPAGLAIDPAAQPAAVDRLAIEVAEAEFLAVPRRAAGGAPPGAPSVLVVEDNCDLLAFLVSILGAEYRVETAADGAEGLAKARRLAPDVIVTDVMMPRMSGEELVRELRRDAPPSPPAVLGLTARADDELRVRLLEDGAGDFLGKPFLAAELRARVRNLVALKRTRDILQAQLSSRTADVIGLARELAAHQRALEEATHAARLAAAQAEAAARLKSDLLGLVSHELTTPLQSLRLSTEILRHGADRLARPQQRALERVERATSQLVDHVEALLVQARAASGRLPLEQSEVPLGQIVEEVVRDLAARVEAKGLELHVAVTPRLPFARTDAKLIRLVLTNLVGNALKHTARGRIDVGVGCDEEAHTVWVRDTGPGIPAANLTAIFEPFATVEHLREKHVPGLGLGLALAREILKALGGRISVTSEVGLGSTFTLVLPRKGE
jgi:signal transduction histidine kinase